MDTMTIVIQYNVSFNGIFSDYTVRKDIQHYYIYFWRDFLSFLFAILICRALLFNYKEKTTFYVESI
jgi:hypothetical protein